MGAVREETENMKGQYKEYTNKNLRSAVGVSHLKAEREREKERKNERKRERENERKKERKKERERK